MPLSLEHLLPPSWRAEPCCSPAPRTGSWWAGRPATSASPTTPSGSPSGSPRSRTSISWRSALCIRTIFTTPVTLATLAALINLTTTTTIFHTTIITLALSTTHQVAKNCHSANCFAIDDEGQVWAWGRNEAGQLGLGDTDDRSVADFATIVAIFTLTHIITLAINHNDIHLLMPTIPTIPTRFVPTMVNALSGYEVVEVATGKAHTLFLTSCGKVFAAGSNEEGQCGQVGVTCHYSHATCLPQFSPDSLTC